MKPVADDSGWEARMAARAAERAKVARERERTDQLRTEWSNEQRRVDRPWLHGWPRIGDGTAVLIGTSVHCVGCGYFQGIISVAFDDDWSPPTEQPVWPFGEEDCLVCLLYARWVRTEITDAGDFK
jgi:hypothetical protein